MIHSFCPENQLWNHEDLSEPVFQVGSVLVKFHTRPFVVLRLSRVKYYLELSFLLLKVHHTCQSPLHTHLSLTTTFSEDWASYQVRDLHNFP